LEHRPELRGTFAIFERVWKPSGILVLFVPHAEKRLVSWVLDNGLILGCEIAAGRRKVI